MKVSERLVSQLLLPLVLYSGCIGVVKASGWFSRGPTTVDVQLETDVTIRGNVITVDNNVNMDAFLGVPYAEKTEQLFTYPTLIEYKPVSGKQPINATAYGSQSPQFSKADAQSDERLKPLYELASLQGATEDAFSYRNLNIYRQRDKGTAPKPVIVFFHGGALMAGGNSMFMYDPKNLFRFPEITDNMILVQPNYGLSIFGFAAFGDDGSGRRLTNIALRDAIVVLQWVQKYISKFGGDPENVMIWGHSGGATLVHWLQAVLVEHEKKFGFTRMPFNRVYLMSGSGHLFDARSFETVLGETEALGRKLGCAKVEGVELLTCLRANHKNIVPAAKSISFIPSLTIDNDLIFGTMDEHLSTGRFLHVPTLITLVSDESSPFCYTKKETLRGHGHKFWSHVHPKTSKKLSKHYSLESFDNCGYKANVCITTDRAFILPAKRTIEALKKNNVKVSYVLHRDFDLRTDALAGSLPRLLTPTFISEAVKALNDLGLFHGIDVGFVFNTRIGIATAVGSFKVPFSHLSNNNAPEKLIKAMMTFMKVGEIEVASKDHQFDERLEKVIKAFPTLREILEAFYGEGGPNSANVSASGANEANTTSVTTTTTTATLTGENKNSPNSTVDKKVETGDNRQPSKKRSRNLNDEDADPENPPKKAATD